MALISVSEVQKLLSLKKLRPHLPQKTHYPK